MKLGNKLFVLSLLLLMSCATNKSKEKITYIEKPEKDCILIGDFRSMGFSIIPPVASAIAKDYLEQQAENLRANSLRMTKETGLFQVEMEASAYRCAAVAKSSKK